MSNSINQNATVLPLRPDSGPAPGGRQAWLITWMLLALMMINFADKAALGLAHDAILADLGITESQYGVISGGFFVMFSVSALAVGVLSDRYPTKRLLLWMCLLWTLSVIPLLGPGVGFGVLLACRVFLGAAEGPTFGVANHAVQKWFRDDQRNVPVAVLNLGATLGVIVMAPLLSWVISAYGWRAAFVLLAVIGVLWSLAWWRLGAEGPLGAGSGTDDEASLLAGRLPLAHVLRSGTFLGILAASVAAYWSMALLIAYVNPYLTEVLGFSGTQAGTLVALPWALAAVMLVSQGLIARSLMARGVSTRWARGAVGGIGLLVASVFTMLFTHATDGPLQVVCLAVAFSMSGMIFTVSSTVCGELAPPGQRGAVLGAYIAVSSLAGVVAPPVMGRLLDAATTKTEGYALGFTITAIILALGGLLALWLIRPERDAARLQPHAISPTA